MAFKIAVYCITKNEEKFVDRMMESVLEADEIVICDTGSTDGTVDKLKAWATKLPDKFRWSSISVAPWRFDIPRNISLGLVSPDVDICICLDLDEVMMPGWRADLDNNWNSTTTRYRYPYVWSWKAPGVPEVTYWADKIHARTHYRWHHPVHEVLRPYLCEEVVQWADAQSGVTIHHHPDNTKSRGQYLPLLELAVAEDPADDRNAYYLGREYYFRRNYEKALGELARHRSLPTATWNAEKAASHRYSGHALMCLNRPDEALGEYSNAARLAPEMRESWADLAQCYHNLGKWAECRGACLKALEITTAPNSYIVDHTAYGARVHDILCVAAWNLGKKEEALEHAKIAVGIEPHNTRMRANLAFFNQTAA